jgi:hypothetical protein
MERPVFCQRPGCYKRWERDPILEVDCPTCPAKAGEACQRPSGHRPWGVHGRFHPERDLAADVAGKYGECPLSYCGQANAENRRRLELEEDGQPAFL